MNIQHTMPAPDAVPPCTIETLQIFLEMRRRTFKGFAEIEEHKGLITPRANFNTPHGQEVLRMLMFRVIEECVESMNSKSRPHILEEAIDAYNYLWSILVVDEGRLGNDLQVATMLYETFVDPAAATSLTWAESHIPFLSHADVGCVAAWLAGDVGDLMRNRAWMNNAQDVYFTGNRVLALAICRVSFCLYRLFSDWQEFAAYYIAKDAVLQFRLRTNY